MSETVALEEDDLVLVEAIDRAGQVTLGVLPSDRRVQYLNVLLDCRVKDALSTKDLKLALSCPVCTFYKAEYEVLSVRTPAEASFPIVPFQQLLSLVSLLVEKSKMYQQPNYQPNCYSIFLCKCIRLCLGKCIDRVFLRIGILANRALELSLCRTPADVDERALRLTRRRLYLLLDDYVKVLGHKQHSIGYLTKSKI